MKQDNETKDVIVETYAEDMAKVLENDKSGIIRKIIYEEEKHEIEKRNLSPESKKNKFFMLTSLLFILLGLVTLSYFMTTEETPTVSIERQLTPLIFNDKSIFIEVKDLKKEEIAQVVSNAVKTAEIKDGGVEGIYLTENKQILGLRKFISLIKGNFIPGANLLFIPDNFSMGVVNAETKDFFILLKMRSLTDIFDAMHSWEEKMFFDLHEFFGIDVTAETKYLLTKEFQDSIVKNKNARILYASDNQIVIMYILANDTSVVITNTKNAGEEIMLRLAASQIKK
ncbi:MAG: hypothetical protein US12_C0017G0008 [Parcubacteria group bacterium GW2011_GWA2_36_24]|nr:MAG: hypothetical protein US12_C0017G0008 [Parcubacteria group bacterium GW2011_GWA2_36_24]